MNLLVKSILFACLGVCCLALGSSAQQEGPAAVAPQPAVQPPLPALASPSTTTLYTTVPSGGAPVAVAGQSGFGSFGGAAFGRGFGDPYDGQASLLAKQIGEAKSEEDKDKLKKKLNDLLVKQFDDRQKRHEQEIAMLEAQVKKLKETVSKRAENKKDIIEERTKQLEREAKGLGW